MLYGGVKYINYFGPKYGEEKKEYFTHADIFIFPSYYQNECFPLVLLEAMQYKLPIVTTDEGGIPDIVINKHNGIISKRKDATSLANSIETLITNKTACTILGENGYKIFKEKFTKEQFEKNFMQQISTIL